MQTESGEEITHGSVWYVRYGASQEVLRAQVTDVTAHTVELKPLGMVCYGRTARFSEGFVKFIERTSAP